MHNQTTIRDHCEIILLYIESIAKEHNIIAERYHHGIRVRLIGMPIIVETIIFIDSVRFIKHINGHIAFSNHVYLGDPEFANKLVRFTKDETYECIE